MDGLRFYGSPWQPEFLNLDSTRTSVRLAPAVGEGYAAFVATTFRYLSVLGLAFWLGGLAFYGAVVIPTAHDILGNHRDIGFVTRVVTGTTNTIGFAVLGVLLANTACVFKRLNKAARLTLALSLTIMALAQVALFVLRRTLDGLLDPAARTIADHARFLWLHERYLNVTSVLCLAALVHLWAVLLPPNGSPSPQSRQIP